MGWQTLKKQLKSIVPEKGGPVVVAFSGGVDSSVTALAVHELFRERSVALTAHTELFFPYEQERVETIVRFKGLNHRFLPLNVLGDERVAENGPDRCYWCKRRIFGSMREIFGENAVLLDGTNADDDPKRPGMKAAGEFDVLSPLRLIGISKTDVRELARGLGLPNYDQPSNSCAATRIAIGQPLREAVLAAVKVVENRLVRQGVNDVRARVDDLMMTVHYPSRHAWIVEHERENVQRLIAGSVLRNVEFREWQA